MDEAAFFFGVGADRVYGVLHRPPGPQAQCGIVLCAALAEEKLWSYRVYVGVARELARRGFAVLRFDCRGEGESDLEFEQSGLATRAADAARAAEVLLGSVPGLRRCVFLGHRLGCAVAALAARDTGPACGGLIAWDPVENGRNYLMQLLRSALAAELALTGRARTRAALIAALERGESVAVEGYLISPAFYGELAALEWPRLLEGLACPVESIEGACEPAFWRASQRLHGRAPAMTARSLRWLEAHA